MTPTKIVLIGAGSVVFSLRFLQDLIYHHETLDGSTIVLVDINEDVARQMSSLARRLVSHAHLNYAIEWTTNRVDALVGAEYVIIAAEIDRDRLWRADWEIPLRHGVRHVLGENAGPGGLSHTLRTVPMILEMCRDIERLCPDAWVLNLTNPENRICLAISRYTSLKAVGLCHGIGAGYYIACRLLGLVAAAAEWPDILSKKQEAMQLLEIKAAGINHFTWMLDIREKTTGRDLYPALREAARQADPEFEPLSRYLLDVTGLMLATGDQHAGELIGYAWEFVDLKGYDFDFMARRRQAWGQLLQESNNGSGDLSQWTAGHSVERVVDFIAALHGGENTFELSANIPNRGSIAGLPEDGIVEVPVLVSASGIHGLHMGALPTIIAAMCAQQLAIQELSVEAAVHGDRRTALQALLLDPVITSTKTAEAVLDDLLEAHAAYLPQFNR